LSYDLNYVVETHVLIWYFIGSKRLKRELKGKMDEVRNKGGRLLVPTIVLADSHRRKRQSRI